MGMGSFNRFYGKCDYCEQRCKLKYCCEECKNRADVLRRGVINSKKLPKYLSRIDKIYIQDYSTWLFNLPDRKKEIGN
jgi:hypothetical protein